MGEHDHRCRIRDTAGGLISADWCLDTFADVLAGLPDDLSPENVLRPELRLFADGSGLEIYYAPFELVNPDAELALVGITPGRQQMYLAIREVRAVLRGVHGQRPGPGLAPVDGQAGDRGAGWRYCSPPGRRPHPGVTSTVIAAGSGTQAAGELRSRRRRCRSGGGP